MHPDEHKLRAAGYLTKRFTVWHFQVKMPEHDNPVVNVWPTARKILAQYEPGPAPYYDDIVAAVDKEFAHLRRDPVKYVPGMDEVFALREGGLAWLRAKYGLV